MRTALVRIAMAAVLSALASGLATSTARGGYLYFFTAENDSGEALRGSLTLPGGISSSPVAGPPPNEPVFEERGGRVTVFFDGEKTVFDNSELLIGFADPGGTITRDSLVVFAPYLQNAGPFLFSLIDDDATAFPSFQPGSAGFIRRGIDLDEFETRTVIFRSPTGEVLFSGQVTSLFIPEPSTLALCLPAALLGLVGWCWRHRRSSAA